MKKFKLLIGALIATMFVSCSADLDLDNLNELPYLSLPNGIAISNLNKQSLQILSKASKRIEIVEDEDGILSIKTKDAAQINVSPEIFQFFIDAINNTNEANINMPLSYRKSLISRAPEHIEGYTGSSDCLAWATAAAVQNHDYEDVSSYIVNKYGPRKLNEAEAYEVMSHFGNVRKVDYIEPNGLLGLNYVVLLHVRENIYHAVNGLFYEGDDIYCIDYQSANIETGTGGTVRKFAQSQIISIYIFE